MHYLASKELQLDNEALRKVVTRTQVLPEDRVYPFKRGTINHKSPENTMLFLVNYMVDYISVSYTHLTLPTILLV